MEQVYTPNQNFKVLVNCMTYNQSKYIEDALNGFVMQKTDFSFVCLVMDDASTDGEQEVIKAWMERECDMEKVENLEIEKSFVTIVPHRANVNCTFAFYFLKENLYKKGGKTPMITPWREHCEYEALCEGDDYWIDNNKLQNQVSFLDSHQEYSASATNSKLIDLNGTFLRLFSKKESRAICALGEIVPSRQFHTATVVFRQNSLMNSAFSQYSYSWDTFRWSCLVSVAPIYYSDTITAIYRRGCGVTTATGTFNWFLQIEKWANTLVDIFYPDKLSWTDAYYPLLREVTAALLRGELSKDERAHLKSMKKRYNTNRIRVVNAKAYIHMYYGYLKRLLHV